MEKFIIDEEIQKHILPPLHPDELPKLEANILADGEVREPLVVWNGILLDGHNRWAIIQKYPELPYKVKEIDLPDRWAAIRWIQNNQLGRRNLTEAEKKLIVGNMYRAEQKAHGGDRRSENFSSDQKGLLKCSSENTEENTRQRIAKATGTSEKYVRQAVEFAKGLDAAEDMLSGVNDALNNIRFSENHLMQTAATYALSYATQGLTNSLFGQIERVTEPNRMTTYVSEENPMPDWLERVIGQASAKIPGWDFQQTEYLDEFGKTESNGNLVERIFENILSPGYWTSTHEGEQLYDELQDLHDETGANPWPDTSPPKSFTAGGEKYTLDQEAKEKYQQTQGDIYTDLGGQVLSKGKRLFTPEEMVDILANIKSYAGTQAKKEFYGDHDIEADTTVNFIGKAVAGVQEAGIPFVTYLDFWCKKDKLDYEVDEKGKKKVKEAVVRLIDSMKLTDAQKDWLYNEEGYKGDVTWH